MDAAEQAQHVSITGSRFHPAHLTQIIAHVARISDPGFGQREQLLDGDGGGDALDPSKFDPLTSIQLEYRGLGVNVGEWGMSVKE